ncbi:DUF1850 domain-containing protein [Truepera radiovictrix]|uniref:DUF1850 domain-containing protein n=1 Tax=Truepera radiovictrix (strain DSM 17093 / CIP 108686 / LMG 22925 / RQ-24) TaxID=649638 RepID=D7CX72_TRURR|nr:DUF1850 domain-containing protein [Truepera radiovictrix]ADI13196.1 Domain of unknown function DUF1850 [Truepera radiovictrix DSM 17093]WMT58235.1 DUF1850 domain-containing protein [Truepera radiovictrix]
MRRRHRWLVGALLLGVAAAHAQQLVVMRDDGAVLLRLELSAVPTWEVRWYHSVAGFEVRDRYRLKGGQMLLQDSYAPDFAAGLGHIPGRGRLESDPNGGYWLREIDEPVPNNRYALRVGSARVDHRLVHAGRSISLSALAAGERVTLAVVPAAQSPAADVTP